MSALTSTLVAMCCYSVSNWIMEEKFSRFDALTVVVGYSLIIFVTLLTVRTITNTTGAASGTSLTHLPLVPLLLMGLVFAAADYFYISAYTKGASAVTATSILVLVPVLVSVIKYTTTLAMPNLWQVAGYLLGIASVFVTAKGTAT